MSSHMEPDARDLLQRVGWSIAAGFLYMMINSTIGIWGGWMFFYDRPTLGNYIFYAWLLFSTVVLIRLLVKLWKKKLPHG